LLIVYAGEPAGHDATQIPFDKKNPVLHKLHPEVVVHEAQFDGQF
jgi:hypothetical protein